MAPRTGLQLLHTAALLVVVAYLSSGSVLAADDMFTVRHFERFASDQCVDSGFDMLSLMEKTVQPCQYADSPAECSSVPEMSRIYICVTNSVPHFVTVEGVKSFDISLLETWLHTFSSNVTWNGFVSALVSRCAQHALPTLTPQQLAVYSGACLLYSLVAHCDLRAPTSPPLEYIDVLAVVRRERVLNESADMIVAAFGPPADSQWAACSRDLATSPWRQEHGHAAAVSRYADMVTAVACLLQDYVDSAGIINSRQFLDKATQTFPAQFSAGLQELEAACGPDVAAYQTVTAHEFLHCWSGEGAVIAAWQQANREAAAFPETCTIIVTL